MRPTPLTSLLLLVTSVTASTEAPKSPAVRFPEVGAVRQADPRPDDPVPLSPNQLYVVDSDVELILKLRPAALLQVSRDEGPVKIRGSFVGGSGKAETKTFKGKFVYVFEAAGPVGECDVVVVPVGVTKPEDVVWKKFVVTDGTAPRPPPTPVDPPAPNPSGVLIPGPGLKVLIVFDDNKRESLPAGQRGILYGKKCRELMDAKCAVGPDGKTRQWRIWDVNDDPSHAPEVWKTAFARPRTSVPWVVVSGAGSGWEGVLPTTEDEFVALVTKYEGK